MEKISEPLEIGTRIIAKGFKGAVMNRNISGWTEPDGRRLWRYQIRFNSRYDMKMLDQWLSEDDIKIDNQFYRDQKIDILLS